MSTKIFFICCIFLIISLIAAIVHIHNYQSLLWPGIAISSAIIADLIAVYFVDDTKKEKP